MLFQFLQVACYVGSQFAALQLVGFGEDDGEGDAVLAQPFDELQVDGLGFQPAVYQDKETGHLGALQDIAFDDVLDLLLSLETAFCVTVSGQIHNIPVLVDEEVIDQHGFSWGSRGHG